jgi:NodT family efflux transporter outer membrane factor (OMF) lipoprotein
MHKFVLSTLALAAALQAAPLRAQQDPVTPLPALAPTVQSASGWWSALGDPLLASLVEQGLEGNLDIVQAHARIRRSQALLAGARAEFGPSGSAGLQGRAAQASETEMPGASSSQRRGHSVQAALEFSWEVDLFGRLDSRATAASERVRASQAQLQGVRLAVSAEIAHAYFALVGAREQLALARTVAANRERTLRLVDVRATGGIAAPIDAVRARADLEAAHAQVPLHEAAARVATHRLAVLTGRSPAGFDVPTAAAVQPASIAIRVPEAATWLPARPDVQEQEAELQARALDVQAVRAEFYPRLSISGLLGFVAGSVTGLGAAGSVSWLGGPSLLAPIFDRPRIEARLAAAKAGQKEALAAYQQRLLLATEEVENALARYTLGQQQFQALQRRAQLAVEAERLSRVRYEAGAGDLLELLDAQRSAQEAQAALAVVLMEQRQHLVAVFKGMGAGA